MLKALSSSLLLSKKDLLYWVLKHGGALHLWWKWNYIMYINVYVYIFAYIIMWYIHISYIHSALFVCMQHFYMYTSYMSGSDRWPSGIVTKVMEIVMLLKELSKEVQLARGNSYVWNSKMHQWLRGRDGKYNIRVVVCCPVEKCLEPD